MIVHPHQLVDQVAELSRISINLVASGTTHWGLLILKLLLQD